MDNTRYDALPAHSHFSQERRNGHMDSTEPSVLRKAKASAEGERRNGKHNTAQGERARERERERVLPSETEAQRSADHSFNCTSERRGRAIKAYTAKRRRSKGLRSSAERERASERERARERERRRFLQQQRRSAVQARASLVRRSAVGALWTNAKSRGAEGERREKVLVWPLSDALLPSACSAVVHSRLFSHCYRSRVLGPAEKQKGRGREESGKGSRG